MSATAGPLLLLTHGELPAWGAFAIGYVEGVIAGFALRAVVTRS
jgi:hypothetical protein